MDYKTLRQRAYQHRSGILLLSTAALTTVMMVTRVVFAIKVNEDIAGDSSACTFANTTTTTQAPSSTTYNDEMAISSAVLFAANTLFAMIFRTYNSLNRWWFANSLTAEDLYVLEREFSRQAALDSRALLVANDNIAAQVSAKFPSLQVDTLAQSSVQSSSYYAIGLSAKRLPVNAIAIKKTTADYIVQGVSLLPLLATNLLRLFYAFYAYNQLKEFAGVGYALAIIQAPLQFFFRSADTALLAMKLKDQAYANPKSAIFKFILTAALTYVAMPYGLFFSQALLSGTEQFFNHHLHNHDACQLQAGQDTFLWTAAVTFALPALEYLYYFLSQPLTHLRQWSKELGPLLTFALFAVGAGDAFYSAFFYPKDLVDAHMPQASSAFKLTLVGLYTAIYSLYYIPGNIQSSSQIHKQLAPKGKTAPFFSACCKRKSLSADNEGPKQNLLTPVL